MNNLGVLALEEDRWELAIRFFQGALQASPNDAKTHYLLARAFQGNGDLADAQNEIQLALQLKPEQPEFLQLQQSLQSSKSSDAHELEMDWR